MVFQERSVQIWKLEKLNGGYSNHGSATGKERSEMMEEKGCWSLWQLLDSILPTGGFAHSMGLEAAVQMGFVFDSPSLHRFALSTLHNSAALLLPFVYASSTRLTIPQFQLLDCTLHACLSNHVARNASIAQGTALLRVSASVFSDISQTLREIKEMSIQSRQKFGHAASVDPIHLHHAPLFGFILGSLRMDPLTIQRAFLFVTLRDLISAATRLNIVGPLEAAQMQHNLSEDAENLLTEYANRPVQDCHQAAPVIDVIQGAHDNLFSRLFRS